MPKHRLQACGDRTHRVIPQLVEWFLIAGLLFLGVAVTASILERLPVTLSVVYMGVGMALGPWGAGMLDIDPSIDAHALEKITEVAVVISLFGAGLKMRVPPGARPWQRALRLAGPAMIITIALVALGGWWLMGLGLGAAVLLGAVLAPTDPVLASEVQLRDPFDRDALRRDLTAEAGLNDGTAFPFVVLGIGLVAAGSAAAFDWGWWTLRDLAWPVVVGPVIGWTVARIISGAVLWLRRRHGHAVGLDEFLALGIMGTAYALALLAGAYGFLAVFAAGVAVRGIERRELGDEPPEEALDPAPEAAVHEQHAPAWMAHAVLDQSERLERIASLGVVVMLGALLARASPSPAVWGLAALLLFVIRPVAVWVSLAGSGVPHMRRLFMGWFGLRGVGSLYYLAFAIAGGLAAATWQPVLDAALIAVAASVVLHGLSVTPLLEWRERRLARR